ncbi:MAG: peptidoglycan-binding protein [Candidatus Sericytochromatia bacterium]|nr:peptidoglycan-binding protein [Candidatus Sericytochromatia bacterium]
MSQREIEARQKCAEAELWLEKARQPQQRRNAIQRALALYRDVLQMPDIQLADPYLGLAWLAFSSGQPEQARAALNTAEAIDPGNLRVAQLRFRLEKITPPPRVRFQSSATAQPVRRLPVAPPALAPEARPASLPPLGPERLGCCARGERVKALQQALKLLGFEDLPCTGVYDQATFAAVQKLQFKHKLKLTGTVEAPLEQRLLKLAAQKSQAIQASSEDQSAAAESDAVMELGAAGQKGVRSEGTEIKALQTGLLRLGFGQVICNARYDVHTTQAVRQFQQAHGLKPSGRVDRQTRERINQMLGFKTLEAQLTEHIFDYLENRLDTAFSEDLSMQVLRLCERFWQQLAEQARPEAYQAPEPIAQAMVIEDVLGTRDDPGVSCFQGEAVEHLQRYLLSEGYDLKVNGQFDLQTFSALKSYQQAHGLAVTGQTDDATRVLLNQAFQQRFQSQLDLEGLRDIFARYCEVRNWSVPAVVLAWCEQLLRLTTAADFEAVLRSLLPDQIRSELGPAGSSGNKVSEGPEVELLQLRLRELGEALDITGVYDAATQAIVRRWQGSLKLPLTGWVNAATATALFADAPSAD